MCIGCPGWKCEKHWLGKCVFGRPTWNNCCKRGKDPTCTLFNKGCEKTRKLVISGLRGAENLLRNSDNILKKAKDKFEQAKKIVQSNKRLMDIANTVFEGVKRAHQIGREALSAIAKLGLEGVFNIKEISFDVSLNTAAEGHFKVSVTMSVMHKRKHVSLYFNMRDITSFAKNLSQHVIHGLGKFIS